MGGAVSSGRDNDELIDNLMGSNYIRTHTVEEVFRALDRAEYMTPDARDQAYKDLAWRSGSLHMSAPCIYSEVVENLELKPGLSFLNVGSGTGYLSTLVGLILGSQGISHGVELRHSVVEYANKRLGQFLENSPTLDEFDFCEPKFYLGNGLCLAPLSSPYDRVYCGAGCPTEYTHYFKQLIKVGGVLVMPVEDNLVQIKRLGEEEWSSRTVLNVSFATLYVPTKEEAANLVKLDEQTPVRLQVMARAVIRSAMRGGLRRRHPELRAAPARAPPAKKACPRRICIPIDDESDVEGLGVLHDLYRDTGASEMNALLSFMLSMGHNRVAGALRFDADDSSDDDSLPAAPPDSDDDDQGGGGGGSDPGDHRGAPRPDPPGPDSPPGSDDDRPRRCGLITLDFCDVLEPEDGADPARLDAGDARMDAGDARMDAGDARMSPPSDSEPKSSGSRTPDRKGRRDSAGDSKTSGESSRGRRSSGESSRTQDNNDTDNPDVPAEVEIYLGKTSTEAPGSSKWSMEWEEGSLVARDSGLPSASSSSSASPPALSDPPSGSLTDDADDVRHTGRRRLRSGSWSSRGSSPGARTRSPARRNKRRAAEGGDARRTRLSILMKRGVKELPLPHALKKFVNLQRCFEF